MKNIEQSHKILSYPKDVLELIELCGRTCYKSEPKLKNEFFEMKNQVICKKCGHKQGRGGLIKAMAEELTILSFKQGLLEFECPCQECGQAIKMKIDIIVSNLRGTKNEGDEE